MKAELRCQECKAKVRGGERKIAMELKKNTTNEKNNKSGKEEQKPGTEIGEGETEQEI